MGEPVEEGVDRRGSPSGAPGAPGAADGVESVGGASGEVKRRSWEEMDGLRAQMVREGYALNGFDARERERVWRSLAGGTRRAEVLQLLGVSERELQALIARLRVERLQLTGRR